MTGGPRRGALESLLATKEIVVFCGSGGVGKTSVAAAAALGGGDPARRQGPRAHDRPGEAARDALGLEGIGNVERRVPDEALKAAGLEARGELWAAMLDTKQSWDDLVLRHAPDEETAYRILDNRMYDNITARFVQSHDYIAMERLFEIHATGKYDLIVIDTPPTRNAIDFLDAPEAHGRLLRRTAAALAHDAVPRRRQARRPHHQRREPALLPDGRPHARQPVPPGHRGVLPQLPVDVRRLRRAGRRPSSGCSTTGARRSRSSPRSRPRRCARPSSSATS